MYSPALFTALFAALALLPASQAASIYDQAELQFEIAGQLTDPVTKSVRVCIKATGTFVEQSPFRTMKAKRNANGDGHNWNIPAVRTPMLTETCSSFAIGKRGGFGGNISHTQPILSRNFWDKTWVELESVTVSAVADDRTTWVMSAPITLESSVQGKPIAAQAGLINISGFDSNILRGDLRIKLDPRVTEIQILGKGVR